MHVEDYNFFMNFYEVKATQDLYITCVLNLMLVYSIALSIYFHFVCTVNVHIRP